MLFIVLISAAKLYHCFYSDKFLFKFFHLTALSPLSVSQAEFAKVSGTEGHNRDGSICALVIIFQKFSWRKGTDRTVPIVPLLLADVINNPLTDLAGAVLGATLDLDLGGADVGIE